MGCPKADKEEVEHGSKVYTDQAVVYDELRHDFVYDIVDKVYGYGADSFTSTVLASSAAARLPRTDGIRVTLCAWVSAHPYCIILGRAVQGRH
jgi:hypothetical protein